MTYFSRASRVAHRCPWCRYAQRPSRGIRVRRLSLQAISETASLAESTAASAVGRGQRSLPTWNWPLRIYIRLARGENPSDSDCQGRLMSRRHWTSCRLCVLAFLCDFKDGVATAFCLTAKLLFSIARLLSMTMGSVPWWCSRYRRDPGRGSSQWKRANVGLYANAAGGAVFSREAVQRSRPAIVLWRPAFVTSCPCRTRQ